MAPKDDREFDEAYLQSLRNRLQLKDDTIQGLDTLVVCLREKLQSRNDTIQEQQAEIASLRAQLAAASPERVLSRITPSDIPQSSASGSKEPVAQSAFPARTTRSVEAPTDIDDEPEMVAKPSSAAAETQVEVDDRAGKHAQNGLGSARSASSYKPSESSSQSSSSSADPQESTATRDTLTMELRSRSATLKRKTRTSARLHPDTDPRPAKRTKLVPRVVLTHQHSSQLKSYSPISSLLRPRTRARPFHSTRSFGAVAPRSRSLSYLDEDEVTFTLVSSDVQRTGRHGVRSQSPHSIMHDAFGGSLTPQSSRSGSEDESGMDITGPPARFDVTRRDPTPGPSGQSPSFVPETPQPETSGSQELASSRGGLSGIFKDEKQRSDEKKASSSSVTLDSLRGKGKAKAETKKSDKSEDAPSLLSKDSLRRRLGSLVDMPYPVDVDPETRDCTVNRLFMAHFYGGNPMAFCPLLGKGTRARHPYRNFMYPGLSMNPELPSEPGQHGLLCRASQEVKWKAGHQKLLVGLRSGAYRYMGEYVMEPAEPLSVEEFRSLPETVKTARAEKVLVRKGDLSLRVSIILRRLHPGQEPSAKDIEDNAIVDKTHPTNATEIKRAFDRGAETMYIWKMRCVGYDENFQRELPAKINEWSALQAAKPARRRNNHADQLPRHAHGLRTLSKSDKRKARRLEESSRNAAKTTGQLGPGDVLIPGVDQQGDNVMEAGQYRHGGTKSRPAV